MFQKYKFVLISATIGLLISIVLLLGQKYEALFFLSGAPYYIDSITVHSGTLVSYVCFLYFILLFSFAGYLFTLKLSRSNLIVIFILILVVHGALVYLGGKDLFRGLFEALKEISKKGINIKQ